MPQLVSLRETQATATSLKTFDDFQNIEPLCRGMSKYSRARTTRTKYLILNTNDNKLKTTTSSSND